MESCWSDLTRWEEKSLRISIERSGGFAGITVRTTIDEKDLVPDEALKLRRLVEQADLVNLSKKTTPRSARPDRFQYDLSLEDSGQKHTVTTSEEAMPENLKPLVKWLMEKGLQSKKSKGSR